MHTLPHQLTTNIKLLQKVVIRHRERILILQRSATAKTRPNNWDLPGGNAEWPETTENRKDLHVEAVLREIEEETGITSIAPDTLRCIYVGTYFVAATEVYSIIIGWTVELPDAFERSSIVLSAEHQKHLWIESNMFDAYDFGFAGEKDGFIREMVESATK